MDTTELYALARTIRLDEKNASHIISQFRSETPEFNEFVYNLRAPYPMIAGLIEYYASRIESCMINKFDDLTRTGTLFCLADGTSYQYAGKFNGVKYATASNSDLMEAIDVNTPIKWIF